MILFLAVLLWASTFLPPIEASNGAWNDPSSSQYHIQTDEGPERYFRYQTLSGQYRKEKRLEDGTVIGSYAWIDPDGYLRQRDYIADNAGYRILRNKNIYVGTNVNIGEAVKAAKKAPDSGDIPLVRNDAVNEIQRQVVVTPRPLGYSTPSVEVLPNSVYGGTPSTEVLPPSTTVSPLDRVFGSTPPSTTSSVYLPSTTYLPSSTPKTPTSVYLPSTITPPSSTPSSFYLPASTPFSPSYTTISAPAEVFIKATTPSPKTQTYLPPVYLPSPKPSYLPSPKPSYLPSPKPSYLPASSYLPSTPKSIQTYLPANVYLPSSGRPSLGGPSSGGPSSEGPSSWRPSPVYLPSSTPKYEPKFPQLIHTNDLDYSSGPQYEHYPEEYNPYIHQNGPTYPIDTKGHSFNPTYTNNYDPQYPYYDGISVTNDGFRYYIPKAYHEEQSNHDTRSGSFGYIDPFGIRRVVYYNAGPDGFKHRKNNRYVGHNATPYDPRPY